MVSMNKLVSISLLTLCLLPLFDIAKAAVHGRFINFLVEECIERKEHVLNNIIEELANKTTVNTSRSSCLKEDHLRLSFTYIPCSFSWQTLDIIDSALRKKNSLVAIILSSCENLKRIEATIRGAWKKSCQKILKITVEPCSIADDCSRIFIDKSKFKDAILTNIIKLDLNRNRVVPAAILHDASTEMITMAVSKLLYKKGYFLKIKHFPHLNIHHDADEHIIVFCDDANTNQILQMAMETNHLYESNKSWVIITAQTPQQVLELIGLNFRYNSNVLIVHFDQTAVMDLEKLCYSVLQKAGPWQSSSDECNNCELSSDSYSILRVVKNPNLDLGVSLKCTTSWDMALQRYDTTSQGIWGPMYPNFNNKHFRVIALKIFFVTSSRKIQNQDFGTVNTCGNGTQIIGGFFTRILDNLAIALNFSYSIRFSLTRDIGSLINDSSWNGLLGEIYNNRGDILAWPIERTQLRSQYFSFLTSYTMYSGVKLLYRNPKNIQENLRLGRCYRSYVAPYSTGVWLFLSSVILSSALAITIAENVCVRSCSKIDNSFKSPMENLFYAFSAIAQQGWDRTPEHLSSRVTVIFLRIFCLQMLAGYSAVLVSRYVTDTPVLPFNSVAELMRKQQYELGILNNSDYHLHLMESKSQLDKGMLEYMNKNPENMFESIEEGLNKITKEKFVGVFPEYAADYEFGKSDGFLKMTESNNARKFQYFIMAKGSPYVDALSTYMVRLHESGIIKRLKKRWWSDMDMPCSRKKKKVKDKESSPNDGTMSSVQLHDVMAVIATYAIGVVFSLVVLFMERRHFFEHFGMGFLRPRKVFLKKRKSLTLKI